MTAKKPTVELTTQQAELLHSSWDKAHATLGEKKISDTDRVKILHSALETIIGSPLTSDEKVKWHRKLLESLRAETAPQGQAILEIATTALLNQRTAEKARTP